MTLTPEQLKNKKNRSSVVFMKFTRLYKQHNSALFCFFEGEDSKYYGIRIKNITGYNKPHYFDCEGKESVLRIYKLLSKRKYYQNAKLAYFIDKDFDESIYQSSEIENASKIYETPCYSIENFYTSLDCIEEIIMNEFKIEKFDEYGQVNLNFKTCLDLYKNRQREFHEQVGLLNAYIACLLKNSEQEKLYLDSKHNKLMKWFIIEIDKIESNYTIDNLNQEFSPINSPSDQEINQQLNYLKSQDCKKSFRGKFEIEFLRKFLEKLKQEANKKQNEQRYFSKKITVSLLLSNDNILSQLSQYADTPDCLVEYLEQFKENVNINQ